LGISGKVSSSKSSGKREGRKKDGRVAQSGLSKKKLDVRGTVRLASRAKKKIMREKQQTTEEDERR